MIRRSRGVVMEAMEREWREAMELTLEKEGGRLCAEAYKGFESRGRGCVFVSVFMSYLEVKMDVLMLPLIAGRFASDLLLSREEALKASICHGRFEKNPDVLLPEAIFANVVLV